MTPARLDKKTHVDHDFFCNKSANIQSKMEAWAYAHASLCLYLLIIVFLLLFVVLCSALCGVSATESGTVYNQFNHII